MTEEEIRAQYSTPSLRRNELTRSAKKDHLADAYKMRGEEAEKVLLELYGPKPESTGPKPVFDKDPPKLSRGGHS